MEDYKTLSEIYTQIGVTRLNFNQKKFSIVKKGIEQLGGCKEDFITDEIVELGDDEEYVKMVINYMKLIGIPYLVICV